MSKCGKIGHDFRLISEIEKRKLERCKDCGIEAVFESTNWALDREYAKAHRRDFIQPSDKEAWNLAYPDRKIIDDPKRKAEMEQLLEEKMGKSHLPKIATEFFVNYGMPKAMEQKLKWHWGV